MRRRHFKERQGDKEGLGSRHVARGSVLQQKEGERNGQRSRSEAGPQELGRFCLERWSASQLKSVFKKALQQGHTPHPPSLCSGPRRVTALSTTTWVAALLGRGVLAFPTRTDPRRESNHCIQT